MKQKSLLTSLLLITGLCLYTVLNTSHSSGFGSYQSSCGCHGGATGSTTVSINAPTFYAAGQTYPVTVTVTNTSLSQAGFQVQTNIGTLSSTDSTVTIQGGNMSAGHNQRKSMVGNTATFNLMWTAPTIGGTAAVFNAVGNAVNGSGTGGDQWNSAPSTNVALPVSFTSVSARQIQDYIEVYFSTADEDQVETFEIEKSTDGTSFSTIASLNPSINANYRYQDYEVSNNQKYYYRIKEVSLNQEFTYSDVFSIIKKTDVQLSVYPTLIENDLINVKGLSSLVNPSVKIYDMSGKILFNEKNPKEQINLSALTTGNYTLAITENSKLKKIQQITIR